MSTVRIPARSVRSVDAGFFNAARCVTVDLDLTEDQMLAAIKSMLAHVPGETWAAWVEQINGEVVT